MQKEESDMQATPDLFLIRMQTKEDVSDHSEKVNYIHDSWHTENYIL